MKVRDIRSFFKSPKNGQGDSTRNQLPTNQPTTVEVPSKLSRAGRRPTAPTSSTLSTAKDDKSEKKGKKKARVEEDDDVEDPTPKVKPSKKGNHKGKKGADSDKSPIPKDKRRRLNLGGNGDDDDEEAAKSKAIFIESDSDSDQEIMEQPTPSVAEATTSPEKLVPQFRAQSPKASGSSHHPTETMDSPDKEPAYDRPHLDEKKATQRSGYFKMLSRGGPKNLGSKEVPTGLDGCLNGLTFVQSGVLESFERDDIEDIIGKYGGRMTSAVSSKTSYLLMGNEPGETKRKKAKDPGVPIIDEDDFLELIRKSNPHGQSQSHTVVFGTNPAVKMEPKSKPETHSQESASTSSTSLGTNFSISSSTFPEQTWVEKYRPKTLRNLVGQTAGDRSNANKLLKWLRNWFQYHGRAGDKVRTCSEPKDPEGRTLKAALLSGPPGIGKTTMAHLVCKEVGLDYFELNASDTRNKRGLHEILTDLLSSKSLYDIQSKTLELSNMTRKHVLIMDEVDGMSGNEDRGGIGELISLIKSSRIPIICICNDRNHQKIRSLASYCFDLRCSKPSIEQLKGFLQSICFKEKMKIPYDYVIQMVKSTDFDIRQIINQLQLLKETDPANDNNQSVYNPRKDIMLGPWDVVRKVFSAAEHVGMTLQDKNSLFFQDYSFGPLFVQENYARWEPAKARGDKYKTLDLIRDAAESIATGDLVDTVLHRTSNWSLLPTQAIFASILPGEMMEGKLSDGMEFPRWLGKNSTKNKVGRILQQLHTHVHLQVSGSLEALNLDYLPYLRQSVFHPLVTGNVGESAKVMQDYALLREDLDNINELTLWPGMRNPLERVDTKTKASLTRRMNKDTLPYPVIKVGRGEVGDVHELEGSEGEEEEESHETDAMIKKKTRSKTRAGSSKAKPKVSKPIAKSKAKKTAAADAHHEEDLDSESDSIDDSDEDKELRKKTGKKRKVEPQAGSKAKKSRK